MDRNVGSRANDALLVYLTFIVPIMRLALNNEIFQIYFMVVLWIDPNHDIWQIYGYETILVWEPVGPDIVIETGNPVENDENDNGLPDYIPGV